MKVTLHLLTTLSEMKRFHCLKTYWDPIQVKASIIRREYLIIDWAVEENLLNVCLVWAYGSRQVCSVEWVHTMSWSNNSEWYNKICLHPSQFRTETRRNWVQTPRDTAQMNERAGVPTNIQIRDISRGFFSDYFEELFGKLFPFSSCKSSLAVK